MSIPGVVRVSKNWSRTAGVNCFESSIPRQENPAGTMTAAATTGPASGPRPASSIPATSGIPLAHSSFSNRRLQGMPDAYLSPNDAGCKAFFAFGYATPSEHFGAPSPKSLGLRSVQNGPPARRSEPDWQLEGASRTSFALARWMEIGRRAKLVRDARRSRLEKQPRGLIWVAPQP